MKGNEPAFPLTLEGHRGLTKREYFAGLAMQAYVSGSTSMLLMAAMASGKQPDSNKNAEVREALAQGSVAMADALLAELEKQP